MIKVFVAVPTTGSVVDSQAYFLRDIAEKYKDKVEFVYPKTCVRRIFHDFARNALVEDFLDSGADILWFLDSDVTPPHHTPDLITEHLDAWKVAGAVYPVFMVPPGSDIPQVVFTAYTRADNGQYTPQAMVPQSGQEFVDGLATGCLLVKREVFTTLLPERPFFKFSYDENTRCMTEGEDFYFMRRCNDAGLKFFTDYSMVCKHQKSVDLLDVNNYAMTFANNAVKAYDSMIKEQIRALSAAKRPKSNIVVPKW